MTRRPYNTAAWQQARRATLNRAGWQCEHRDHHGRRCGRRTTLVHHKDGQGPDGPHGTDPANLQALCPAHHRDRHEDQRPWPPREMA